MIDTTAHEVKNLVEQGYSVSNIAVLSFHGVGSSVLVKETGPEHLAGIRLRRQSQEDFNPDGTAVWTDGELLVDTLFRFKGQAADAVVITEIDFSELDLNARRRLFVALTRARLQAVLVTTESAAKLLQERLAGGAH
jgi:superfamily I DNA and RNA helicase